MLEWQLQYHTHLMSKLYSLTSEVAAYLPLFYRLLLSDVDCGVELCCHVVTMPPVGRERWWTAGYAVGWPDVRTSGGVPGSRGYVAGQSGHLYRWVLSWCVLSVKVKGHMWGFFGTAVCRLIVPLPPMSSPSFISRGATHHIGTRDLC